jgi:hypothetical protein
VVVTSAEPVMAHAVGTDGRRDYSLGRRHHGVHSRPGSPSPTRTGQTPPVTAVAASGRCGWPRVDPGNPSGHRVPYSRWRPWRTPEAPSTLIPDNPQVQGITAVQFYKYLSLEPTGI